MKEPPAPFTSATLIGQVVKPFSKPSQICIAQASVAVDLAWGEFVPPPYQVFGGAGEPHLDQQPAKELDVDASHL